MVFAGVFGEKACFCVVFLWGSCGVLRGEGGQEGGVFSGVGVEPLFLDLFFSDLWLKLVVGLLVCDHLAEIADVVLDLGD